MQADPLAAAVRQCPFLARVGAAQGEHYARNLAGNPFARASAGPVLLEEDGLSSFAAALRLFHGPGGVVPLKRFAAGEAAAAPAHSASCPFLARAQAQPTTPAAVPSSSSPSYGSDEARKLPVACSGAAVAATEPARLASQPMRLPFASISISGFGFAPDPGEAFRRAQRSKQQQRKARQPDSGHSRGGNSPNGGGSGGGGGTRHNASSGGSPGVSSGGSGNTTRAGSGASGPKRFQPGGGGAAGATHGPHAGWTRALGGLLPLAAGGRLSCPAPIVKMRAAVAALKPVRELRPRAMPIRALAIVGTAAAANLPCGAWREHTDKFSAQWFLAVHATVPFVAMLRKAVLMPKWAMLLTLVGAIAGQKLGATLERGRMQAMPSPHLLPRKGSASGSSSAMPPDLRSSCRQYLRAAQSAVAWTLAPVVVA